MRRCLNPKLSRSAIHRCLQRHGISQRPKPAKPVSARFEDAPIGFIHIDLKHLPALERRKSYAFVAIDRATRYVYVEIHPCRDAKTAAAFLERFLAQFPAKVHTILTDNGSEFTDRFAVDMKGKPEGKPSGTIASIASAPQPASSTALPSRSRRAPMAWSSASTDASVKPSAASLNPASPTGCSPPTPIAMFLAQFVYDYNHTRLKCLGYLAPLQVLANLTEPNTCAGMTSEGGERVCLSPARG